jgi:hypothetical protein
MYAVPSNAIAIDMGQRMMDVKTSQELTFPVIGELRDLCALM